MIVSVGVEVEPFGDELFDFADSVEVGGVVVSFVEVLLAAKFVVEDDVEVWFFILGLLKLFEILRPTCHNSVVEGDFGFIRIRVIEILSLDIEHGQSNFNEVLDAHRYHWLNVWAPVF